MRKFILLISLLIAISGCSFAKSNLSASKSSPTVTITKTEQVEGKPVITVTETTGETYKITDNSTFLRGMSPFGMSAIEGASQRKITLDEKGFVAGADYGWLERSYIGLRSILVWIIGGVAVLFACTWIPGPVGAIFKTLFSALPFVGGLFQGVTKSKVTKNVVDSVDNAMDKTLNDQQKKAFKGEMSKTQDKATEKVVKAIK